MPSAQTLVTGANCLSCIPREMQLPVLISIFAELAGMSADAQTLVNNAKCLQCIDPKMQMPVLIYVASQITGGGTGTRYTYVGTLAERNAYANPPLGMIWTVTNSDPADQFSVWLGTAWTDVQM
jgi:hypothetical protein